MILSQQAWSCSQRFGWQGAHRIYLTIFQIRHVLLGQYLEAYQAIDYELIESKEYETHNPASRILYTTNESYIIGNLESYDKRQYPSWLNEKYQHQTPEGQGFGHCFVIPRKRVFNIVDPAATSDNCALIKKMKADFEECWSSPSNRIKILHSAKDAFEAQNLKLEKENEAEFKATSPPVREDYDEMAKRFLKLEAGDFVFAFHPHPEHSVGHLHMHVFPREEFLRRVSSKQHDKKTIPIEAVIEVEAEGHPKVA